MTPGLDTPRCPRHPDAEAHRACERCGTFMCRACSHRWSERRCPDCRPRYALPELEERRLAEVKRVPFVRCGACSYEGPALLRGEPASLTSVAGLTLLSGMTCGLAIPLSLVVTQLGGTPHCVKCGRADELEPSLLDGLPAPPELAAMQWRDRRARLVSAVLTAMVVLVLGALVWLVGRL